MPRRPSTRSAPQGRAEAARGAAKRGGLVERLQERVGSLQASHGTLEAAADAQRLEARADGAARDARLAAAEGRAGAAAEGRAAAAGEAQRAQEELRQARAAAPHHHLASPGDLAAVELC